MDRPGGRAGGGPGRRLRRRAHPPALDTLAGRSLVDESLPQDELEWIRATIRGLGAERGVVAFHKLRARQAGARRYVDVHLQFADGTTLEAAHETAHELTNAIRDRLTGADILVHVEPRDRVEPGTEIAPPAP
jgi:divalent metal cation (Fe/Co/Zn/Cd) transporter